MPLFEKLNVIMVINKATSCCGLLDTLEAKWPFQTLKRPLSDWFRPKYKYKVSSYMDNTKVLLCRKLNLGLNLNYFSFLL